MGLNAISMSSAVSFNGGCIDAEHQRIISRLRAYGVEPTGDKAVDKAKLQKIEESKNSAKMQSAKPENDLNKKNNSESETAVNNGAGSDQIAMLNKLRFGLI